MLSLFALMMVQVSDDAWFPGTSKIDEAEVIPRAYQGIWGTTVAACEAEFGTERMEVKAAGANFWEAGARLERVTQAGQDRTVKVKLSYEGEGEFWETVETWSLNPEGTLLTVSTTGERRASTFVKCQR